jgi:dihydroorotase
MNRRRFISASAAAVAAATAAHVLPARAAGYDLIIKGGQVIDPAIELNAVRDVAIAGGKIVAIEPSITAAAAETIDAHGKIVCPGLIDVHTHAARNADSGGVILRDGVTCWIDAGSAGADTIEPAAAVARNAPQMGRLLLNIARTGITDGGELVDIEHARVDLARGAIERHRDVIVGIKARLSQYTSGNNDLEAVRRAQEAAAPFGLPVMVHVGQSYSPLPAILSLLKRGDIVTHLYAQGPNGAFDAEGRVLPEVMAARRRGVWFDFGNGVREHFNWTTMEQGTRAGFWPDTISTDWTPASPTTNVVNLPNVMSKFFMFGLPVPHAIGCVTQRASRLFDSFQDRGTLNIGVQADVAILELKEGPVSFEDDDKKVRSGHQRLVAVATILNGKRVAPLAKT